MCFLYAKGWGVIFLILTAVNMNLNVNLQNEAYD